MNAIRKDNAMKKKLICLFLLCALVFSFPAMAAEIEVVRSGELLDNGSFEEIGEDGKPVDLEIGDKNWELITERAKDGKNALLMTAEGAQTASFYLDGLITGNEYTLSAYVKGDTNARASFTVQWQFYNKKDEVEYVKSATSHYKTGMPINEKNWAECVTTFKAPAGAQRAQIMLRKLEAGEVMWDKVSVTGQIGAPKCSDPPPPMPPMPEQGKAQPAKAWEGVEGNLLKNPDMETLKENGEIESWSVSGGEYGENFQVYKENPHGGNNAGWMYHDERMSMNQSVQRIVPGETYKLTAWMKADKNASPAMKIEWGGYDAIGIFKALGGPNKYFTASDKWQKIEIEAVAPEGTSRATIMLRLLGEGSVYFDDVSFTGPQGELVVPDPKPYEGLPTAIDGVELLENGGFESTDGIDVYGGEWENNKYVMLDTERVWEGNTSLKISTSESGYPWARFTLFDLEPGAKYAVSMWVNADSITGSMAWKYEFYTGSPSAETGGKQTVGMRFGVTNGGWVQQMDTFTVPEGQPVLRLYARLYGTGTCWFDNISLVKIDEPQPIRLVLNKTVVYEGEEKEFTARTEQTEFYTPLNGTAKFSFGDGVAVFQAGEVPVVDGCTSYTFSTAPMTEIGKEYYVDVEVYKEDGSLFRTYQQICHVYPRPENIRRDGVYLDENGEPFVPMMMYHVMSAENVAPAAEAGINVIQGYASDGLLEECQKHGVQLLAVLYWNMKPAGHPENIARTIETVTKYKDHPAIFAWAVMDEPNYNMSDPYELLRISYKTIRDIDKKHPVYIVEEPSANVERSASYADAFCLDPYIGKRADTKEIRVADQATRALNSPGVEYRRSVMTLHQTFDWNGYWPDENDYRHQMYQAFLAGVSGVGGYAWDDARPKEGETSKRLDKSDLWPGMVAFAENELELAGEHFVLGKYPVLNEERNDKIWHHSFIKDGEVYVVALNLTKEAVTQDIPLTSFDGKVKVSSGTVSAIGATAIPAVGDGKMTVSLEPSQCVRYQITGSGVDGSGLHESKINDIYMYPWARAQILEMEARGIANIYNEISYAPGKAITRGDFAMFLVRTLGLTNEPGEQFVDVDPAAEYAKELAVGRAAGILNGIGDNKYNPEAPITRQELMTIISRGLALGGAADMSAFSDSGLVSDWAAEHVSAMIASGLIKGNADGTLNPLGNTTRAETAVICQRILDR